MPLHELPYGDNKPYNSMHIFQIVIIPPALLNRSTQRKTPDGRELYHPEDPLYPGISPKNLRTDVGYSEWQSI